MPEQTIDEPVTAELVPVEAEEPAAHEPSYAELLAEDYEAMAALIRSDPTGTVAQLLKDWPAPALPHHHYPKNGAAVAMAQALRALRPIAIGRIVVQPHIPSAHDVPVQVFFDVPLRTRVITLVAPRDAVAVSVDEEHWELAAAIVEELSRKEGI